MPAGWRTSRSRRTVGTVADPTFLEAQTKTKKRKTKCEALINLSVRGFGLTTFSRLKSNLLFTTPTVPFFRAD